MELEKRKLRIDISELQRNGRRWIKCNGKAWIPEMKGVFDSTWLVEFFSQMLKIV